MAAFGYLLFFAAIVFLSLEVFRAGKSIASASWPVTSATLDHWDMEYLDGGDAVNFSMREIKYSYVVDGRNYVSNVLGYGFPSWIGAEMVDGALGKVFRNAPNLTVHYKQSHPAHAVLITGFRRYHAFKIVIWAMLSLLGTAVATGG